MSCGVGCRRGSDPALLWLWCRLAATALIGPLAWEPPHATRAALETAKRQKKKKKSIKGKFSFHVVCLSLFLSPWTVKTQKEFSLDKKNSVKLHSQ